MSYILVQTGEEYKQKTSIQQIVDIASWDIGLYNSSDAISDADDLAAITTEPATADDYARETASVPGDVSLLLNGSGNIEFDVADQTFTVSANTETVDSWFIVIEFTSDVVNSESGDNPHLIMTGALSSSKDLTDIDNLTVQDVSGELD